MKSGLLAAVGYNPEKQILAVEFASGAIFHYAGIPADLVQRFVEAESLGKFYTLQIRGKFQGEKMTGPCANCGAQGWVGETCTDCGTAAYIPAVRKPAPSSEAAHG